MASAALAETKRLLSFAAGNSTSQARRTFQEYLITLPKYPSYECKAFFGTLVAKFFAEFEDLQDATVDAVLDLCEDDEEKTRIVGIKGLGATAKADRRWVRGNAGVLLQLLECPPSELRHVKDVLRALLELSPSDVFSVMIDDCRGSEAETGASRRNIIQYLRTDAVELRQRVLETGEDLEAEKVFRDGFMDVLGKMGSEGKLVLEMLLPLSTISGKNATTSQVGAFVRAIADLPGESNDPEVVHMFDDFAGRNPPIDPKDFLPFFVGHGEMTVKLALQQDAAAVRIVERLSRWAGEAASHAQEREGLRERDVLRFCTAVFDAIEQSRSHPATANSSIFESLFYAMYKLNSARDCDSRRELSQTKRRMIQDIARSASAAERRAERGSKESRSLRNVRDMAEILADDRARFERIIPSWEPTTASASVTQTRPVPTGPREVQAKSDGRGIMPNAPRGPRSGPNPVSRNGSTTSPAPRPGSSTGATLTSIPSGPRGVPRAPRAASPALNPSTSLVTPAPSASAPATASKAHPQHPRPASAAAVAGASSSASPASASPALGPAPARRESARPAAVPTTISSAPTAPTAPTAAKASSALRGVELLGPPSTPSAGPSSQRGVELLGPPSAQDGVDPSPKAPVPVKSAPPTPSLGATGSTIRGAARAGDRDRTTSASQGSRVELLPHTVPSPAPQSRNVSILASHSPIPSSSSVPTASAAPQSLLERLGKVAPVPAPAPASASAFASASISAKRTREGDERDDRSEHPSPDLRASTPSLLSRLSGGGRDQRDSKRPKEDIGAQDTPLRSSLKDRLNGAGGVGPASGSPRPGRDTPGKDVEEATVRNVSVQGISIKSRSTASLSQPQPPQVPQAPQVPMISQDGRGLSIKNRSQAQAPTSAPMPTPHAQPDTRGLNILNRAKGTGAGTSKGDEEPVEVYTRRGRGFQKQAEEDVTMWDLLAPAAKAAKDAKDAKEQPEPASKVSVGRADPNGAQGRGLAGRLGGRVGANGR